MAPRDAEQRRRIVDKAIQAGLVSGPIERIDDELIAEIERKVDAAYAALARDRFSVIPGDLAEQT